MNSDDRAPEVRQSVTNLINIRLDEITSKCSDMRQELKELEVHLFGMPSNDQGQPDVTSSDETWETTVFSKLDYITLIIDEQFSAFSRISKLHK